MIEFNFGLAVIGVQTIMALLIAAALLSDAACHLPKWHRFLISTGAAALFAQAALMLSDLGAQMTAASAFVSYSKDICIALLALAPVAILVGGRCTSSARTSRTSPPSDPHPDA